MKDNKLLPLSLYFCYFLAKMMVEKRKKLKNFRSVWISPQFIKQLFHQIEVMPPSGDLVAKSMDVLQLSSAETLLLKQMLEIWYRIYAEDRRRSVDRDFSWRDRELKKHRLTWLDYKRMIFQLDDGRSMSMLVPAGSIPIDNRPCTFSYMYSDLPKKMTVEIQELFGRDNAISGSANGRELSNDLCTSDSADSADYLEEEEFPVSSPKAMPSVLEKPAIFSPEVVEELKKEMDKDPEKSLNIPLPTDFDVAKMMASDAVQPEEVPAFLGFVANKILEIGKVNESLNGCQKTNDYPILELKENSTDVPETLNEESKEDKTSVGTIIRLARKRIHMSQQKLADLINRGIWYVQNMEEDEIKIPASMIRPLSKALRFNKDMETTIRNLI